MAGYYPPESFYPPAKRIRPNPTDSTPAQSPSTASASAPPSPPRSITPIEAAVLSLPPATLKAILLLSAQNHPDIASHLYAAHNELILAESQAVISFDHLSKTVWHALNPRYRGSGSREYDLALEALTEVEEAVAAISDGARKPGASFGTRKNALETLRKIGKSLVLANGLIAHEVHKGLGWQEGIDAVMIEILRGMSVEERAVVRGELEDKVRELRDLNRGADYFGRLEEVLRVLCEEEGDEDEDEDEEGHEEMRIEMQGTPVPTVVMNHHH